MHESKDESLDIQIKTLKEVVENNPKWRLYEIYSDKDSGGNVFRPDFQKLIFDCYENRIDIVLVKTLRNSNSPATQVTVAACHGLLTTLGILRIFMRIKEDSFLR